MLPNRRMELLEDSECFTVFRTAEVGQKHTQETTLVLLLPGVCVVVPEESIA